MVLLSALDLSLPLKNPVIIFSLVLFIILFAPILLNKIKVPHIIGLIVAGVIVGPYGLNLLNRDSSIVLFGTVGLLYIMFLAGLEMDIAEFKKNKKTIIVFGLTVFLLPMLLGCLAGYFVLGYSFISSLLLASMLSTHTLVSYPIASKYGIARNRAVTLTIGGTLITDVLALFTLAAIAGMAKGEVSSSFWIQLGVSSIVFVCIVIFIFPLITRWFFKNYEDSVSQYIFILAMVFLASFLAQAAGLEPIIGAFLSGLVLNRFVPHSSPLMNRINFVGNAIFIPFFLISIGMLVDIAVFAKGWGPLKVAAVIICISITTRYLASLVTQKAFGLSKVERKLIHGLSSSHAAATLAIILVGYNIIVGESEAGEPVRLLNEDVLNGTILLILVSCGFSSFMVEKASKDLALEQNENEATTSTDENTEKILLSLAYSELVPDLVDLGMRLRHGKSDVPVYGLHVIDDDNASDSNKRAGQKILEKAVSQAAGSGNDLIPITRYDSSISNGIVYSIREHAVTDVVLGLHKGADAKIFLGNITEAIIRLSFETVYIYRPVQPLNTLRRIVVVAPPKAETEAGFLHWLSKLLTFAKEGGMSIAFYAEAQTLAFIKNITQRTDNALSLSFKDFSNWDDFLVFSGEVKTNDLFIIVSSRKGNSSYIPQLGRLPHYLSNYFVTNSFILLYPKQIESGINMEDIEQADSSLIETISDQVEAIGNVGKYIKGIFKK